jgi:hypothetical protein
LESCAELPSVELFIAVVMTIALVGIAPISVTFKRKRTAVARVLLARFPPLVVPVLTGNAFDVAPIAA